jgi:hypothetical protein
MTVMRYHTPTPQTEKGAAMRKYTPHFFVAAVLHLIVLFAAHKIAVEIIELVRDEIAVTFTEYVIALAR